MSARTFIGISSETLAQLVWGPNESVADDAERELRARADSGQEDALALVYRLDSDRMIADHPDADRPPGTSGSWGER